MFLLLLHACCTIFVPDSGLGFPKRVRHLCLTRTLVCCFGPGGAAPAPILVDMPPSKDGFVQVLMRKGHLAFVVVIV